MLHEYLIVFFLSLLISLKTLNKRWKGQRHVKAKVRVPLFGSSKVFAPFAHPGQEIDKDQSVMTNYMQNVTLKLNLVNLTFFV